MTPKDTKVKASNVPIETKLVSSSSENNPPIKAITMVTIQRAFSEGHAYQFFLKNLAIIHHGQ